MASFEDFKLDPKLLRGIKSLDYSEPTKIQKEAIPLILKGQDLIAEGQPGSGITATFAIGILQLIDTSVEQTQAIVISPTHESAKWAEITISRLGRFMGAKCCSSIGGTLVPKNIEKLEEGVHVATGTLGRLLHMMRKRYLKVNHIKILVIDEVDLIMEKKFTTEFKAIRTYIRRFSGSNIQTLMFSSTISKNLPKRVEKLRIARNPARIQIPKKDKIPRTIEQYYYMLDPNENRSEVFCRLFPLLAVRQTIVFCVDLESMNELQAEMESAGLSADYFDPDMDDDERGSTVTRGEIAERFLRGFSDTLVNTGSWSRGVDLERIRVVINYNQPTVVEYLHTITRCGRRGRKGVAITLILPAGEEMLQDFARKHGVEIKPLPADPTEVVRDLRK